MYPEIIIIRVNDFNDIAKDSLDEWIYFLKNSEIKKGFQAAGLKEAAEKLRVANMNEEEYRAYQTHLDNLRDMASLAYSIEVSKKWAKEAEQKAEEAEQKAEEAKQKAEQKVEKAEQKAEKAEQKAEEAKQKAEKAEQKAKDNELII